MAAIAFTNTVVFRDAAAQRLAPSRLRRLMDALYESRRRRAENELQRHLPVRDAAKSPFDDALLPFAGE